MTQGVQAEIVRSPERRSIENVSRSSYRQSEASPVPDSDALILLQPSSDGHKHAIVQRA